MTRVSLHLSRAMRVVVGGLFLASSLQPNAWSVDVQPVINASILGGQYYYNAAENSFNSIASITASPYIKVNDQWSVEPLYSGNYHGTQQVQDLVGGGTLFQDSQEHTGTVKVIRSLDHGIKLKAIGAYSAEYLRETKDDSWGGGLYDNRRASGGAEAEWSWASERYLRLSYDYYAIRFPNYTSLESQGAAEGLGRELNAPDVLDTHNHALTLGTQLGLPGRGWLDATAAYTTSHFSAQHLVDGSGDLTGELRHDSQQALTLQGTWPVWMQSDVRVFSSLGYNWAHLYSDQNHYDAGQLFFNPNYYSYTSQSLENVWTLAVGDDPWTVSLTGTLGRQKYGDRLTQDAAGVYGVDATHVNSATIGISASYPIARGFHLTGRFDAGWNDSNNEDNKIYQYHYNTQAYLLGFTYEY